MNTLELAKEKNIARIETEIARLIDTKARYAERYAQAAWALPTVKAALLDCGLKVESEASHKTGQSNFWEETDKLKLCLTAKSSGAFKFLTFAGYDASGRGRNQERLSAKAGKIEAKVFEKTGIKIHINSASLEVRGESTNKSVLIDLYL